MLEIFGAPLYEKCSVFAEFFVAKGAQRQIVVVVVRCASKKTDIFRTEDVLLGCCGAIWAVWLVGLSEVLSKVCFRRSLFDAMFPL